MEWFAMLLTGLGVLLVFGPVIMLLGTFFVLVPLAHLTTPPPMLAAASFDCPVTRRHVSATFETDAGSTHPSDVVECSLFTGEVRCKKACLESASTTWPATPMVPRYSLVSDGVAIRERT